MFRLDLLLTVAYLASGFYRRTPFWFEILLATSLKLYIATAPWKLYLTGVNSSG
jgi:hypothetical protein